MTTPHTRTINDFMACYTNGSETKREELLIEARTGDAEALADRLAREYATKFGDDPGVVRNDVRVFVWAARSTGW